MRTGVITQKVGMTRLFQADGTHVPVTVLKLDGCAVVGVRTRDKDGYTAVQLGSGFAKAKNASKAERGQFAKAEMEPRSKVAEFRIDAELGHLAAGFDFRLGELAAFGLVGVLRLGEARTELDGGVTILLFGTRGHDGAAVELENGNRNMRAVCQKQTGHADLLGDDACAHLTLLTT